MAETTIQLKKFEKLTILNSLPSALEPPACLH
jgi:hypothetical protein